MRPLLLLATLLTAACGGLPIAPTASQAAAPTTAWNLAGQSNASGLRPFLQPLVPAGVALTGDSEAGAPLKWWDEDAEGWLRLKPTLLPSVTRFIWFQGEGNAQAAYPDAPDMSTFARSFDTFIRRVRTAVRSPALPVYVCQLKAKDRKDLNDQDVSAEALAPVNAVLEAWVKQDGHATFVRTEDLEFEGGFHMTPAGYQALAARLAAMR